MAKKFVLYAPSVRVGGGLVLLQALLRAAPADVSLAIFCDARAKDLLPVPAGATVFWADAAPVKRLRAEWALRTHVDDASTVLCFQGLPPLFVRKGRIVVFLQNVHYIQREPRSRFTWKARLRLKVLRMLFSMAHQRVDEYIIQTASMRRLLDGWLQRKSSLAKVTVRPFVDAGTLVARESTSEKVWDFIYVADGVPHKNHQVLLDAWCLLAQEGLRPSLALTLSARDRALSARVDALVATQGLAVSNIGEFSHESLFDLYGSARALIFPSLCESYGLPLIEASAVGLPIVASELDYVRDVCQPAVTFDPTSPHSIAAAVRRFLGVPESPARPATPDHFLEVLLEGGKLGGER